MKKSTPSKRALVLAGGGISGAVYEIGALRAIDDLLTTLSINDFDMYVGTSAGSLISSCLANGITTRELLRILEGALPDAKRLQRDQILALNLRGLIKRGRRLPRLLAQRAIETLRRPQDFAPLDWAWKLLEGLPNGIYSTNSLERYLRHFLTERGSNHFAELQRELYIVATELDSGDRAVFGEGNLRNVPISAAVAASSAMPIVYEPVRINGVDYIDGGVRGTASLDVAIDRGAKLIVCVNPLVAFDNRKHQLGSRIADAGIQAIGNQVFRTFIQAGLHYHIKKLRQQHPDVDIILIEPRADDAIVFAEHVLHYDERMLLARHGYESATIRLADKYQDYKAILAKHGVQISRQRVAKELHHLFASDDADTLHSLLENDPNGKRLTHPQKSWRTVNLAHTLDDLDARLGNLE
ncbi:patatin-like phospholipase family protein [Herpetosiphon sp.]|uniref:Patatin n=1 Tax=Herpetosiphon aurantiacus (strain ATCC 23779 / DSM 785 / 114-95) TaxID=316274 RepID=A9B0S2_HERA2|nr:patatin-like phospholipase family protein [Herpetosiphon sp.]ABX03792.1 Patatin [Herpetosiphon aurantiacus DSM 785]